MLSPTESTVEPLVPEQDWFKHTQLDQKRSSIRLIQVLREPSRKGLIQCKLKHAFLPVAYVYRYNRDISDLLDFEPDESTAKDMDEAWNSEFPSYSCLSYMWGDPEEQHAILMNGKTFKVRRNLWDFLRVAQNKLFNNFLWIDALCIDQQNTQERNHQVQQMGNIYSRANMVLLWLGDSLQLELVLYAVRSAKGGRELGTSPNPLGRSSGPVPQYNVGGSDTVNLAKQRAIRDLDSGQSSLSSDIMQGLDGFDFFADTTGKVEKLLAAITEHEYWSRAWVTQEILLAKRTIVLAGRVAHNLQSLARRYREAVPHYRDVPFENIVDIVIQRSRTGTGETGFMKWGVINLLHRFRNTNCSIQRDRVYSLLALCTEGQNLKVDYDIPEQQLMRQVMSLREKAMCFCSAAVVSDALGPWEFTPPSEEKEPAFMETYLFATSLNSAICPLCSNWVPFSWTRKKGLVFCLGIACPDTQGHLFWEQTAPQTSSTAGEDEPSQPSNTIHVQTRKTNKSQLLSHEGDGVEIKQSPWSQVYSLRFTFRALVELLKEDFTTHGLGLNACPNLWPNPKEDKIGEARLQFCT